MALFRSCPTLIMSSNLLVVSYHCITADWLSTRQSKRDILTVTNVDIVRLMLYEIMPYVQYINGLSCPHHALGRIKYQNSRNFCPLGATLDKEVCEVILSITIRHTQRGIATLVPA